MARCKLLKVAVLALAALGPPAAYAGEHLGPLPKGEISHSFAGPSAELVGYLAFDPELVADRIPAGVRLMTLTEKAREFPGLAKYLENHPERAGWAWSYYEIIGIEKAHYDHVRARFEGGRGGMVVWYGELVRTDTSDIRPMGTQNLALGSWVSDPRLARHMRRKGYPAEDGKIELQRTDAAAEGRLEAEGLVISGRCRLEGPSFTPGWAKTPTSYETMWTPGEGGSFEIVTWAGHLSRKCVEPKWAVSGDHPFAKAYNTPTVGDPSVFRTSFEYGYILRGRLYRR